MTARAVCLGLFCTVGLNLAMNYNDYYLNNSLLIGNHFPTASMAVLLLLVLAVNPLLRARFGQGELLLVWSMIGVGGGVAASGLMRYLPGYLVAPAYYATNANGFDAWLLPHLPSWMVVTTDPDSTTARWFFEGLPRGGHIPWEEWMRPLAAWSAFALLLYGVMFALTSLFFRQWADRERLVFPIVYLPLEMTRAPEPGRRWNGFLANRAVWLGALIPVVALGINGLRSYVPGLPAVPLGWSTWGLFPDRPWSELALGDANVYFSIVGLTFLLATDVSLSFWAFFILYRLSYVWIAWRGAGSGGAGFFGDWWTQVSVFEAAGAIVTIAGFLCWSARGTLAAWWARVRSGLEDPASDPVPARWTLLLLAAGLLGMTGWLMAAGASWWAAAASILLFLAVLLVLTRLVAEAGLLYVVSDVAAYDVLSGLVPAATLGSRTLTALAMQKGVLMHTLREILMPYLMNGVRAATIARMHAGRVLAVFAVTVVVGLGAAAVGRITTCYKYGGAQGDRWGNLFMPQNYLGRAVEARKTPRPVEFLRAGETRVLPVPVAHVGVGAALAGSMLFLRARFLWWPLTPFGFIMCGTWAIAAIWFSIFLGWLAKWTVMTFGGATAYRRVLPFFLGLVLGESAIAALWTVVSLLTGRPGVWVLPP